MLVALLKLFAVLGRVGAFVFAVISLALISLTLAQRNWLDGISIFIVALSVISMFAAWVPPFTNLLYDSFFAAAWLTAAFFAFLIMFLKSTCYGVADILPGEEEVTACPKFQALVAMCFLEFGAWAGCAGISTALLLIAIFKNARMRSHHAMIRPTIYREEEHTKSTEPTVAPAAVAAPIPPTQAPVHFGEVKSPPNHDGPFADTEEGRTYAHAVPYLEDKGEYSGNKRPYSPGKRPYSEDKKPYPAAYGSTTYHIEHADGQPRSPVMSGAAGVAAPPTVTETSRVEEEWKQEEPEYMTVPGWGTAFILRHWVLMGFVAFIAAAVILPLVFLYAVPAFAAYIADNIQLPRNFYGVITGFYETHASFDIFTTFRAPAGISATIQPTTLEMFIGDTIDDPIPVAYIETTQLKIGGSGPLVAYNQTLRIGNITEWSRLWRRFAFQDELGIGIKGEITVKTGPISTTLTTIKVQNFQGLLNATALELEYLRIQPPDEGGANVVVALPVTNPSPLTVDSGAGAVADFLIGDAVVGTTMIDEFKLTRGTGTIVARAKIDMDNVMNIMSDIGGILGSQLPALGRGMAVATIRSTAISQDGIAWPYWVAGARAIKLASAVEVLPLIGGFTGDTLGVLLSGSAGSFFGIQPMTQVIDVNVTGINKLLREMKFYDAVDLGYAEPWTPESEEDEAATKI